MCSPPPAAGAACGGVPGRMGARPIPGQIAGLELRHRQHAGAEDRIGQAKASGLRNLPCFAHVLSLGARHRPADVPQTTWDIYVSLRRQDPNIQHRFEHAKGTTQATCHGQPAICAESFRNTYASGPSHSIAVLGVLVLQVRKQCILLCLRMRRQRLLLRKLAAHAD